MSKCILCNSNIILPYGDDRFGEVFCKDCYEKYNCLHCNRMNIEILCDKNNNIIDVLIKKMYGLTVARDSTLISLFEPGYKFKLYCKECWDTQDMYIEDDIESIEPEEDDEDEEYSDNDEDTDEEYNGESNDLYYSGKGKYDLY
jgi:hypothetical protein